MIKSQSRLGTLLIIPTGIVWAVLVVSGLVTVWNYENRPGQDSTPPSDWPRNLEILPADGAFTLVMLAHPECPCTRSSLAVLDVILARCPDNLSVDVVFHKPGASLEQLQVSSLWRIAERMPRVRKTYDPDGSVVAAFGARVSGTVLLYNPDGALLFSGGITAGRGHEGDSFGMTRVAQLARGESSDPATAPVFGCALANPAETPPQESAL
jgi:hypothetical protein